MLSTKDDNSTASGGSPDADSRAHRNRRLRRTLGRTVRFVLVVVAFIGVPGTYYYFRVKAQVREEQERSVRLLASAADHLEKVLKRYHELPRKLADRPRSGVPQDLSVQDLVALYPYLAPVSDPAFSPIQPCSPEPTTDASTPTVDLEVEGEPRRFRIDVAKILAGVPLPGNVDRYLLACGEKVIETVQLGKLGMRFGLVPIHSAQQGSTWAQPVSLTLSKDDPDGKSANGGLRALVSADAHMVCQPFESDTQQLCAVFDSRATLRSAIVLFPHQVPGLVLIFGLGFMLLPILKLMLMNRRERFGAIDLGLVGLSTLSIASILTLSTMALHSNLVLRRALDEQLERIADHLSGNFQDEIRHAQEQLRIYDRQFTNELHSFKSVCSDQLVYGELPVAAALLATDDTSSSCFRLPPPSAFRDFVSVFWSDTHGQQIAKGVTAKANTARVDVSDRNYFLVARDDRLTAEGFKGFFVESILTKTTGERAAMLSMKSAAKWKPCESCPEGVVVAAMNVPPQSLSRAALPRSFGFAVIDVTGAVQFHSDLRRQGVENLLHETSHPERFRSVIASGNSDFVMSSYSTRPSRFYLAPIANTPWWLIVFHDRELPRTIVVEAVSIAVGCQMVCLLLLGGVATWAVVTKRRTVYEWVSPSKRWSGQSLAWPSLGMVALALAVASLATPALLDPVLAAVIGTVLPIGVAIAWARKSAEKTGSTASTTRTDVDWQPWCAALFWSVLAIFPAIVFFRSAIATELTALLRAEVVHGRQVMVDRYHAIAEDLRAVQPEKEAQCLLLDQWSRPQNHHFYSAAMQLLGPEGGGAVAQATKGRLPLAKLSLTGPFVKTETATALRSATTGVFADQLSPGTGLVSGRALSELLEGNRCAEEGRRSKGFLLLTTPSTSSDAAIGRLLLLALTGLGLGSLYLGLVVWSNGLWERLRLGSGIGIRNRYKAAVSEIEVNTITIFTDPIDERKWIPRWTDDRASWKDLLDEAGIYASDRALLVTDIEGCWYDSPSTERRTLLDRLESMVVTRARQVSLVVRCDPQVWLKATAETSDGAAAAEIERWRHVLSELPIRFVRVDSQTPCSATRSLRIWSSCSVDERLVLTQIARSGVFNPEQGEAAATLVARGLIQMGGTPQVCVKGLEDFLRDEDDLTTRQRRAARTSSGAWPATQLALVAALLLIGVTVVAAAPQLVSIATPTLGAAVLATARGFIPWLKS